MSRRRNATLTFLYLALGGSCSVARAEQPLDTGADQPPTKVPTLAPVIHLGSTEFRQGGGVLALAFSADRRLLATSNNTDGFTRIWEVPSGRLRLLLRAESRTWGRAQCLTFSPDGRLLATGVSSGVVIWDLQTGKGTRPNFPSCVGISQMFFSADGKHLTLAASDGTLRVWDIDTAEERRKFQAPVRLNVPWAGCSADGRILVLNSQHAQQLLAWDTTTGKELLALKPPDFLPAACALSEDGKRLAVIHRSEKLGDFSLCLYDLDSGQRLWQCQLEGYHVPLLQFQLDGKTLLRVSLTNIYFHDVATGKELRHLRMASEPTRLAVSSDGKLLAVLNGVTVQLWDLSTGRELTQHRGHVGWVRSVAFPPDGKMVATASGKDVRLWNPETGREINLFPGLAPVAFSPNGQVLAFRRKNENRSYIVQLVEAQTGKEIGTRGTGSRPVESFAFSADGKFLVAGHDDKRIRLWDIASGRLVRALQFPGLDDLTALAVSPDGRLLASLGADLELDLGVGRATSLRIWDLQTGKRLLSVAGSPDQRSPLVFSPDGRLVATADGFLNNFLRIREVVSGEEVCSLPVPTGVRWHHPISLVFSPDGRFLAAGGPSGIASQPNEFIHVWDTATWRECGRLGGLTAGAWSLAFAPDGRRLVAGLPNGTAAVWDLTSWGGEVKRRAVMRSDKELDELWANLADRDAAKAHRAVAALTESREQAVSLLRQRLQPAPEADPRRIADLVAKLDHADFPTRETAYRQLADAGDASLPLLRKSLSKTTSAEVRRRLTTLLEVPGIVKHPESLRRVRAMTVLERIGTPAAREVLEGLTRGASELYETQETKRILERLTPRTGKSSPELKR